MKLVSTGRTISTTEYLERKRRGRRKRLYAACGAGLLLIVALVLVLRLGRLQITTLEVSGAVSTSPDLVKAVIQSTLAEKYLWLIPESSAFLYPKSRLEKTLLRKFPRFSSVELDLQGLQTLYISAIEREPFALYCATGACYFLDDLGFIFDTAPVFTEGVYFSYSSDTLSDTPLGTQFLSMAEFEELSGFIEKVKGLGVKPLSLTLIGGIESLLLENGAIIKWQRVSDISRIYSNLETFLSSEAIRTQKDFWGKVATLDLRTENKVFYTFRE